MKRTDELKGFDRLDIDSKSIILQFRGTKVASVKYYNYRATLYSYNGLLIEEYYDTESKEIARICSVQEDDLKKYLDKINLTDLLH
jgi:hypothetical protein